MLKIPYILRIHGGGIYPSRPFAFHQMLFDQAAAVIAVSTPIQKEYELRHGRPIKMIPSMLPFNRSPLAQEEIRKKWGVENSDMIILFIGSIKKIKGPDLLLDAFLALGREYVEVHRLKLIYAGDGSMRPELEKITAKSALSSRIRFLGTVPHESVCELYKMADIFCIPSLMEARPLSLAEALYNGVPSIGSDITTIKNIIKDGDNGLLFECRNQSVLIAKLKTLVEDEGLRLTLGDKAKRSYQDFYDYEKMVDDYRAVYDRVIALNSR